MLRKNRMNRTSYGKNNWEMIDKEIWKMGTDCDKIKKLIKCNMHVQHKKSKKKLSHVT